MSAKEELTAEGLANVARTLMAVKMFSLASCVMLLYDIVLTFGEEVEWMWKGKLTAISFLWFLNRYLPPLGYIVIIVSSYDASWSKEVCDRYVLFPEALKVVTASVIGSIFIARLYAIYSCSIPIVLLGSCLLLLELAIKIWAFTDGTRLDLPKGLAGCILVGKHNDRFVFTWIAELGFDSAMFFLTFYRTSTYDWRIRGNATSLVGRFFRDGVVYFAVIFVANLATVLIFLLAPGDLKAINATFSTLITSVMVSRLILNIRNTAIHGRIVDHNGPIAEFGLDTELESLPSEGLPITFAREGSVSQVYSTVK